MIRVLIYFAVIAALALGAGWLIDRPGSLTMEWLGWHIETSVPVALAAVVILAMLVLILWSVLRGLFDLPDAVAHFMRGRRRKKGMQALARGLVAVGVGDARGARRSANEARRLVGDEPLTLLLRAQAAQLSADPGAAEDSFRAMLQQPETRALGHRGLFVEARRRGDRDAARRHADEAMRSDPSVPWAGPALLDLQVADGEWDAALATLEKNSANKIVDKPTARRERAVLLTAKALEVLDNDREAARGLATEAAKLAPGLVPAAALAGRLLGDAGEFRRASKVLETAWRAGPHPDIAEAYVHMRAGDAALDRLKRARSLAEKVSGNPEGALVRARAALDAREFAEARTALAPLIAERPSRRVCLLMAELEDSENHDRGRARAWLARAVAAPRDPAWVADGVISDVWQPASPVTGRLDAFVWMVPQENLAAPDSRLLDAEMVGDSEVEPVPPPLVVEHAPDLVEDLEPASADTFPVEPGPVEDLVVEPVKEPEPAEAEVPAPARPAPTPRPAPRPAPELVLPLARAPDDPGPDALDDEDAPRAAPAVPGGP